LLVLVKTFKAYNNYYKSCNQNLNLIIFCQDIIFTQYEIPKLNTTCSISDMRATKYMCDTTNNLWSLKSNNAMLVLRLRRIYNI
jgi:hypothetical protein